MKVDVVKKGAIAIVTVSGRLSSAVAAVFDERMTAVMDDKPAAVVVDLSGLTFITSSGLRTLIIAAKRGHQDGYHVTLCGMTDSIREVFEVSGLMRIFAVHPSLEAGLATVENAGD